MSLLGQTIAARPRRGVRESRRHKSERQGVCSCRCIRKARHKTQPRLDSCTDCAITPSQPRRTASTLDVHVGSPTAIGVDLADKIGQRLPYMFIAILLLSFLLLMLVFRSLLVPLKAVIMNLLSIGAAYGVIVAIFQWGWLNDAVGVGKQGPIEAWVPMMLFAIVFGLSMDYEVFLLSRIKEEYDVTHDNADRGRTRPRQDRAAHHRRGRDHDLRVRQLRALRPARAQA